MSTPRTPRVPSRTTRRTRGNAWGIRERDREREESTNVVDFLCLLPMGFGQLTVPGVHLPANEVGPLLLGLMAVGRRPQTPLPRWFSIALVALLGALAASAAVNHLTPAKRLLHVASYCLIAFCLASGRIQLATAGRALAVAMTVSLVLSNAGFGPHNYAGRLTGMYSDPNQYGMYMTVLGAIALGASITLWPARLGFIALTGASIYRTLSRTTLLAAAFGAIWVAVAKRVGRWFSVLLVVGLVYLVSSIGPGTQQTGPFSDRVGSDQLRSRIKVAEQAKVALHPWIGSGPGTAQVTLDSNSQGGGETFFFHSSYLGLRAEGGWITLGILMALIFGVFWTSISLKKRNPWLEVSLIAVAVCAVNLGEVLLELPAALAIGACMRWVMIQRTADPPPDGVSVEANKIRERIADRRRRLMRPPAPREG